MCFTPVKKERKKVTVENCEEKMKKINHLNAKQALITKLYPLMVLLVLMNLVGCNSNESLNHEAPVISLVDYVDPFIGTDAHGHTFPGATVPFGMVQLSPDNGIEAWDWTSGYHYSDSIIIGFSHTHLSGTGIGDLADILVMPTSKDVNLTKIISDRNDYEYKSSFDHRQETASPGYYEVYLKESKIKVRLTATARVGMHHYTFENGNTKKLVIDLSYRNNWDHPTETNLQMVNDTLLTGYRHSTGWAKDQRLFFAMAFDEPIVSITVVDSLVEQESAEHYTGKKLKALISFGSAKKENLQIKTGLSSASKAGALASLGEIEGWNFENVKDQASALWENELSKVQVASSDSVKKRIFYTALYHSNLAPVLYSDLNNEYKGADGKNHVAEGYTRYDIFSLWDTFRAAHPLFTILQENRVNDMVNSLLAHYDEHGLLPVWSLLGNETNTMTGYHAIPVITDAYFKGFNGFDINMAYEAMKKSAMQDIRGVNYYKEYGFIPSDLEVESVTKNLEYAYDDWCIAKVAKALNKLDDYNYFSKRAKSYQLLYDAETGFMRGKLKDGQWRIPFDPKRSDHRVNTDYTEGNAWQHSWFVPHDVEGLITLMGGEANFVNKLDSLFTESSEITGDNVSVDISGLIGQYAHGNEPSHHVPYLYNFTTVPWKTQERVTAIVNTLYSDQADGLCGNDDCGQMSAWYIFSALGFYPLNPAEGLYALGRPFFEEVTLNLPDNKVFKIIAHDLSTSNIYVNSAMLNGEKLDKPFLSHEALMAGGTLEFNMSSNPGNNE